MDDAGGTPLCAPSDPPTTKNNAVLENVVIFFATTKNTRAAHLAVQVAYTALPHNISLSTPT